MAIPAVSPQMIQTATAQSGWMKFGKSGFSGAIFLLILSWIFGQEWMESLASFICCMSFISMMVAGIIAGQAGTVAAAGGAGVAGVSMAKHQTRIDQMGISQEQQNQAKLVAQRAQALSDEGIDPNLLFTQVANWLASTGTTPGMLFKKLDVDGNDILDPFEIREGFAKMQIVDLPPWLMGSIIALVDADDSDSVDYDEWVALFQRLGWTASEPEIIVDNMNPVAGSTVKINFSAPPWPDERRACIALVSTDAPRNDVNACLEGAIFTHYLSGETIGVLEKELEKSGFWDIRMYDSDHIEGAMEVSSASLVVAEAPMGNIPHYRDSQVSTTSMNDESVVNELAEVEFIDQEIDSVLSEIEEATAMDGSEITETLTEEVGEHPLKEIIESLPASQQAKAWETAEVIEDMIIEAPNDEKKANAQAILTTFVDDVVHGLSAEEWASTAAIAALAATAGVVATRPSSQLQDTSEKSSLQKSSVDEVSEQLDAESEESEPSAMETMPQDEVSEMVEDVVSDSNKELSELVDEISQARFMSEREAVLAQWNDPLYLVLRVERCEKTLGLGLPDSHRGGMSILATNEDGSSVVIRLPAECNDEVGSLKTGSQISCDAIPAGWMAGQKRVSLDASKFERIHL